MGEKDFELTYNELIGEYVLENIHDGSIIIKVKDEDFEDIYNKVFTENNENSPLGFLILYCFASILCQILTIHKINIDIEKICWGYSTYKHIADRMTYLYWNTWKLIETKEDL